MVYAEGLNGPHELRALAEVLEQQGGRARVRARVRVVNEDRGPTE